MIIVRSFVDRIEDLFDASRLPAVDRLRPSSCPVCGQIAFSPGRRFGIVGHGTYRRQVLGIVGLTEPPITLVRRYLCRGCGRTINVLSDYLHPGRWYASGTILEALRLHIIEGRSEREIRGRFGVLVADTETWRSLRRWRSQLLVTLWYWLSRRLGFRGKAETREDGSRRLGRLLSEAMAEIRHTATQAARTLLRSTVHFQGVTWPLGHGPPEKLTAQKPL